MAEGGGLAALRRGWSASGWRRARIAALTVALVLVVGWLVLPAVTTSQETRDARDVFCLQRSERAALADAAVALGLARPGSTRSRILVDDDTSVPLLSWRADRPDDFARTCDALSAVRGKSAAGTRGTVDTVVLPLLTVVLTSALTYVATRRQNRTTRGQAEAGELRAAVTAYNNAANQFLDSRVTFPADRPTAELDAARDTLTGRLNGVVEREPEWLAVRDVVALLRDGELGTSMDADLRALRDSTARGRRITALRARVREVCDLGFLVADVLAEHSGVDRRLTRPLTEGVES